MYVAFDTTMGVASLAEYIQKHNLVAEKLHGKTDEYCRRGDDLAKLVPGVPSSTLQLKQTPRAYHDKFSQAVEGVPGSIHGDKMWISRYISCDVKSTIITSFDKQSCFDRPCDISQAVGQEENW